MCIRDSLEGNALGELSEGEATAGLVLAVDLEGSEVGNDGRNNALAGKGEGALVNDLRVAVLYVSDQFRSLQLLHFFTKRLQTLPGGPQRT